MFFLKLLPSKCSVHPQRLPETITTKGHSNGEFLFPYFFSNYQLELFSKGKLSLCIQDPLNPRAGGDVRVF